jgi:hypothetical protein
LGIEGHSWSANRWGYRKLPDREALADSYSHLLRQVHNLRQVLGLSGAVYTQTTDVETECNGLLTYDRAVAKLAPAELAQANLAAPQGPFSKVVLNDATLGPAIWKYTVQEPGTNWFMPNYEATQWKEGAAGFGTVGTPGALVETTWKTADIWLRREFTLGEDDLSGLKLEAHHDEDAEIYLNGVLAAALPGFITAYEQFELRPEAVATLKPGRNLIAVHCHQTTGGQYIDVGLGMPAQRSGKQ